MAATRHRLDLGDGLTATADVTLERPPRVEVVSLMERGAECPPWARVAAEARPDVRRRAIEAARAATLKGAT